MVCVSEALFYTGVTALFRDPFWGGLSLVPLITFIQVCLLIFVDYLIAGVRKTWETLNRHFILPRVQKQKQ